MRLPFWNPEPEAPIGVGFRVYIPARIAMPMMMTMMMMIMLLMRLMMVIHRFQMSRVSVFIGASWVF